MSFSDGKGSNWSALFDSLEAMTAFLRALVATLVHVAMHQDVDATLDVVVKGVLPPSSTVSVSVGEDTVLAAGTAAGDLG